MKLKKIIAVTMGAGMMFSTVALAACGNSTGGGDRKSEYQIVYNLNYGNEKREMSVPRGCAVLDWEPRREGYEIEGWYTDKDCTKKYDFNKGVYADTELFANWVTAKEVYTVKVDANFAGAKNYKTLKVKDGETFEESELPNIYKFGMEVSGWYTDKNCMQKYDFAKPVTDNLTLYPKYVYTNSIARYTEDNEAQGVKAGDVKFEDLQLNVWYGSGITGLFKGLTDELDLLAEEFNNEESNLLKDENGNVLYDADNNPRHKITVKPYSGTLTQSEYQLRLQQTPEKNKSKYYLNAGAVLDAANGDSSYYDEENWYAIGDSYIAGALGSIPLGCKVPFLVYNKAQMEKYCGEGKVPANYTELKETLKKAYDGEIANAADYKSFLMNGYWPFQQNLSMISFVQNGAPYYTFDKVEKQYSTGWADDAVKAKAMTGAQIIYDLISDNGDCHGGMSSRTTKDDATIVDKVSQGKVLAGVVGWYDDKATNESTFILSKVANDDNLGVLPLSGLFTDDADGEYANAIPVNTLGLQICTYESKRSDIYYAACAVFADYVAKHADRFIEQGIFPMNKAVYAEKIANVPDEEASDVVKLMKKVGDPENFYTMDGYLNGKPLIVEFGGTTSGGQVTVEGYVGEILKADSAEDIQKIIDAAAARLKANFSV